MVIFPRNTSDKTLSDSLLYRPIRGLSGGWKMRLELALGLIQLSEDHSDILLLDEPTNHLDLEAIVFLETYLAQSQKFFSKDKDKLSFRFAILSSLLNIIRSRSQ